MPVTPDSAAAADKLAIAELTTRYMRGQDRLDADLQASAFHSGAIVDYGFTAGESVAFVALAQNLLRRYPATWHMVGQSLIEVSGDQATGEIYFHAWHRRDVGERLQDLQIAGRYLDVYERRDGAWGIIHRREVVDWTRTDPAADDWLVRTPDALRGGRDGADLSQLPLETSDA